MSDAAALKVLSAGAAEGPLHELAPAFTRATGRKVELGFGTAGALRDRFKAGERADVIVLSAQGVAALDKEGAFLKDSIVDLGRATTGVAVRRGAARPDISTPEAFKAALLAATNVAATDPAHGGSSGIYLTGLLARMGIADAMKPKMVLGPNGKAVGNSVADGKAELGITFISEFLPNKALEVVGPLPKEFENTSYYTAAIPAKDSDVEGARAFIAFLTGPQGRECFRTQGLL